MRRISTATQLGGCLSSVAALVLGTASPAHAAEPPRIAQEAARQSPTADEKVTYPAGFFAQYNPITAADMVARVPGFELRDGDDRRGFGATAGNLLVNGERPSSKTVPSELLKRIPAGNVQRIELLSGSDAGVDVRGQSQIVNVVMSQAAARDGSTTFVAGLRHIQYSNRIGWTLQASRSIALSPKADLAVDLQFPNTLGRGVIRETLSTGAGIQTGSRYQVGQAQNISMQAAANLRWRPTAQDSVHLNFQLVPIWNSAESVQLEATPTAALRSSLFGVTDYDNNYTSELGGDWEHRFTPSLSVKLIGLVSNAGVDQTDRYQIFTAPSTNLVRTQARTTRTGERIARVQVKWAATQAHTLEFGGEGAFNFRDTTLDIVNQPRGGAPVAVPLAVANARVEELRGEVFVSDIWQATPALTVETGMNFEVSRIEQTGDQQKERRFSYPKPRITATYVLSPRDTLRLSLVRDVAQLDFSEFSSAIDFVNTSTIQGNPNLVPERAWKARLEWDARFAGRAAVTVAGFYDRVEDVHDLVEIAGFDAFGNIGDGTRLGAEIRGSLPLGPFGLPDAELRVSGLYQQTRVTDPITGQTRSFSVPLERQGTPSGSATLNTGNKDWAYLINFRQNLPKWSASWGATLFQWSGRTEYRRAETLHYVRQTPRLDLYVETTRLKPVTLRLFTTNLLVSSEERTRTFYLGDRASGVIQRLEDRESLGGPEGSRTVGFQVSGRF